MSAARWIVLALAAGAASCDEGPDPRYRVAGGDPEQGRRLAAALACGACHAIPGVPGARGVVGPSLRGFRHRTMIGGVVPNRPGALVAWIRDAPRFAPRTAMPAYDLDSADARDLAAFLYTLR